MPEFVKYTCFGEEHFGVRDGDEYAVFTFESDQGDGVIVRQSSQSLRSMSREKYVELSESDFRFWAKEAMEETFTEVLDELEDEIARATKLKKLLEREVDIDMIFDDEISEFL